MKIAILVMVMFLTSDGAYADTNADAKRGAAVFERGNCAICHAFRGKGGNAGPDLGKRFDRGYTAATLSSVMWNHGPTVWGAMERASLKVPAITETETADLFAFFYSVRYFEKPGEAIRGKQVFESRHCAGCHTDAGPGLPPGKWTVLYDPVELIARLWSHAPEVRVAYKERKLKWPELTGQDLTDILVYLQNLPETRNTEYTFQLPLGAGGKGLYEAKGCAGCHKGSLALEGKLGNRTLTEIAASLWNHAPRLGDKAAGISGEDIGKILAYIWTDEFFRSTGNASPGKRFFTANCTGCHARLPSRQYSTITIVSALWTHGPTVLEKVRSENKPWPRLNPADMSNLVAYLNSPAR